MKHTFRNFVMPLANVVLAMGLHGVLVNKEKLAEFKVQFEKDRVVLYQQYRRMVVGYFNIIAPWKGLMQALKAAKDDKKLYRKLKPNRTAMRKAIKSQLNPNSSDQQRKLFYDILKLKPQKNWKTKKLTADEEAVLKLLKTPEVKRDPKIAQLLNLIIEYRGIAKKISTYCLEDEDVREGTNVDSNPADSGGNGEPAEDRAEIL